MKSSDHVQIIPDSHLPHQTFVNMNFDIRENYHCFRSQYKQRHVIIYNRKKKEKSAITAINWRAENVVQHFFYHVSYI